MRSRLAWRRDVHGAADRRRALGDLFGTAWPAALLLAAAFDRRCDLLAVLIGMLAFFAPILVFNNLHIVHSYDQYADGAFLLAAIAIASLARKGRAPALAGSALVAPVAAQLSHFHALPRSVWMAQDPGHDSAYQIARAIYWLDVVPRDGAVLVLGEAWSSVIPNYAQRKALMLPGGDFWPIGTFADILRDPQAHVAGTRFASVVHCTGPGSDYGPERQPMVDAFLAGRRVLADRGFCRLLAAER